MQNTQRLKLLPFLGLLLSFFVSCSLRSADKNTLFLSARQALWDEPESCLSELKKIDTLSLREPQKAELRLLSEHAYLRAFSTLPADTMSGRLAAFFGSHRLRPLQAEALYLNAAEKDLMGIPEQAMSRLKQAEQIIDTTSAQHELLGALYYRMGRISESDMLYDIANRYYEQALRYLQSTNQHLYLASTLRDLARTTKNISQQQRNDYFDQALLHAAHCDTSIQLNILSYKIRYERPIDTLALVSINKYLCNHLNYPRAASELTEYYIDLAGTCRLGSHAYSVALDSAQHYLNLFTPDTIHMDWSREKYHYLHSQLLHLRHHYDEAERELRNLYDDRTRQLAADGKARTFAISQQYDVLKEKEATLERQVKLQHAYLIITLLLLLILLSAALTVMLILRARQKEQARDTEINRLQTEIQHKRQLLRNTLEQRIQLTKELQNTKILAHKKKEEVPAWAKEYIDNSLFSSAEKWDEFQQQFNLISDNFLISLKDEYPDLTKVDIQIIALIITGLSINDICILLNQSKNTIWSRRLRIKTHLKLTADQQLDQWLQQKYEAHF